MLLLLRPLFFLSKNVVVFKTIWQTTSRTNNTHVIFFFSPVAERKRLVLTPYVGGHFRSSSAPVAKYRLGIPGRPCCPLSPRSCHFFLRFSRKVQNKSSLLKPLSPKDDVSTYTKKFLLDGCIFFSRLHFSTCQFAFLPPSPAMTTVDDL